MINKCVARPGARPRPLLTQPAFVIAACLLLCGTLATAARLRHSDMRSQLLGEGVLPPNKNYKPLFSNSPNYAPVVKEEPPDTEVIRVQTEDNDPKEDGGTITYCFVTAFDEKLKFEINTTDQIRTTQILDRDESFREKEALYLTVIDRGILATDNGRQLLDDICIFKVIILEDVNDNSPVFEVRNLGYKLSMPATAKDLGVYPKVQGSVIDTQVVESYKKALALIPRSAKPIKLKENFRDFNASIVKLKAISNIDNNSNSENSYLFFDLVYGRTEQTNKGDTFRLESNKDIADIKLSQYLDYESNRQYSLIIRVQNKYQLTAETMIDIEVLDVNDNIPVFCDIKEGSVLENELPGVFVMQVRATDADGTSANNQVSYELDNFKDLFAIDPRTGNITTLVTFDREVENAYNIKVIAKDNSPSALFKTGEHNKGQQVFRIEIVDKNDNPPHFTQKVYTSNSLMENANINTPVIEVKAIDSDMASSVTYSIIAGNSNDSFYIEGTTGKIRVKNMLDYEVITKYNLMVRAFDGLFNDTAQVVIFIQNVNDMAPVFYDEDEFKDFKRNLIIDEETLTDQCITTVAAYDPDIEDRTADQHIAYSIVEKHQSYVAINKNGCLKLKKPLDRDPPNGYSMWTFFVAAIDEDGSATGIPSFIMINIALRDINDNAPFLDMPHPVIIWGENRKPGKITELSARDYDSEENGPPFTFQIDEFTDEDIKKKFKIDGMDLYAQVVFDREEQKSYDIPIAITDHGRPPMTGTSTLTVIIGNDNARTPMTMQEGSSSVYEPIIYNLSRRLRSFVR